MPDFKYQASKTIVKSDLGLHTLVLFSLFIDKAGIYFVNVVQNTVGKTVTKKKFWIMDFVVLVNSLGF